MDNDFHKSNPVEEKSFRFAVRILNLYKYLRSGKKEFVISKQVLRSGTSIGANIAEAQEAQSKADFVSKMGIALKECAETDYWLRLLKEGGYLSRDEYHSISSDCREIKRKLVSIVKTARI